ncbi:MAG: type pilus assembly PilZ [Candidatus Solibacter sp.]|nr:type pilus assembly PilZ [Candidatus Solibacter sp.]
MMGWAKRTTEGDAIAGDRRQDRRYEIQLDVKWKLIRRRRVLDTGTGQTVDMSSGGILFDAGRHLPEGLNVELSITWPVLLHNVAPMQLVAAGRIVRSSGRLVAIQTVQHEFRTVGVQAEPKAIPPRANRTFPITSSSAAYALGK